MGLFGEKGYIRVTTPQTIDGTTLRYSENGQRVITKETHLPLTAKKFIEQENENLPNHLKHKVEEVSAEKPPKKEAVANVADKDKSAKEKAKPGPKPKAKDGDGADAQGKDPE